MTKKRDRPKKPPQLEPDDKVFRLTFGLRATVIAKKDTEAVEAVGKMLSSQVVKTLMEKRRVGRFELELAGVEVARQGGPAVDLALPAKELLGADGKPLRRH